MEVALIISSIAGAATAATISKFPKKNKVSLIGTNSQIKAQIDTLKIEKEILTKTISRLYTDSSDLTKIQCDKLLLRYQHQLGVILAKIEKLEQASKHPDLGPLGDGLITLMDQKLSALDKKLIEISTKISIAQTQLEKPEIKKEEPKKEAKPVEKQVEEPEIASAQSIDSIIQSFAKSSKRLEITTLTEIPSNVSVVSPIDVKPTIQQARTVAQVQPQVQQVENVQQITHPEPPKQQVIEPKIEIIQPQTTQQPVITEPIDIEKQVKSEPPKLEFRDAESNQEPEKKKPRINIPEPEEIEDDEDDLDSIKREIMKTLSKLEQAEVE